MTLYIAQGDIFAMPLIAPYADKEIRIFRGTNGEHGFKVLENKDLEGCVFEYHQLIKFMQEQPEELRSFPFEENSGYPNELAVVSADLLDFYVIVSQTCDISGVDSRAKPFACILPILTLASALYKFSKVPDDSLGENGCLPIPQYLEKFIKEADFSKIKNDPYELPNAVYSTVENWQPEKKDKQIRGQIKNFINNIRGNKKEYYYYLPCHKELGVPEGLIDFCRLYTLPTNALEEYKGFRVATINTPYREEFAQKFSQYLSRIATPAPLTPQAIK